MKKMKKQFLSLFVLLCMIISMFPTTALAANIIDVSGNVTITRSDEELTCADNLYYGEVNVNGSATESKTRLTHPVLPLIQWQYGNNTYQIIPSAYKYYVYNINDPNHIPSLTVGKIKMATNPVNMGSVAVFYFVTICAIL